MDSLPPHVPQCARWEGVVRVREPGDRALLEFRGPVYPIDVTGHQVMGVVQGGAVGRQEGLERGQGKLRKAREEL